MRTKLGLSLLAAAMLGLSTAAYAVPVVGTATFSDTGPAGNNQLLFNGAFSPSSLNLNLTAGVPVTLNNYLTITSIDSNSTFWGDVSATDNIAVNFSFTQPGPGSGQITGTGQETTSSFFGHINGSDGIIQWNGPSVITFGDGSQLTILLSNETFGNDPNCFVACGNDTVKVDATFTLASAPAAQQATAAVPEPASLALLGTGLFGLGVVRRNRNRQKVSATHS